MFILQMVWSWETGQAEPWGLEERSHLFKGVGGTLGTRAGGE